MSISCRVAVAQVPSTAAVGAALHYSLAAAVGATGTTAVGATAEGAVAAAGARDSDRLRYIKVLIVKSEECLLKTYDMMSSLNVYLDQLSSRSDLISITAASHAAVIEMTRDNVKRLREEYQRVYSTLSAKLPGSENQNTCEVLRLCHVNIEAIIKNWQESMLTVNQRMEELETTDQPRTTWRAALNSFEMFFQHNIDTSNDEGFENTTRLHAVQCADGYNTADGGGSEYNQTLDMFERLTRDLEIQRTIFATKLSDYRCLVEKNEQFRLNVALALKRLAFERTRAKNLSDMTDARDRICGISKNRSNSIRDLREIWDDVFRNYNQTLHKIREVKVSATDMSEKCCNLINTAISESADLSEIQQKLVDFENKWTNATQRYQIPVHVVRFIKKKVNISDNNPLTISLEEHAARLHNMTVLLDTQTDTHAQNTEAILERWNVCAAQSGCKPINKSPMMDSEKFSSFLSECDNLQSSIEATLEELAEELRNDRILLEDILSRLFKLHDTKNIGIIFNATSWSAEAQDELRASQYSAKKELNTSFEESARETCEKFQKNFAAMTRNVEVRRHRIDNILKCADQLTEQERFAENMLYSLQSGQEFIRQLKEEHLVRQRRVCEVEDLFQKLDEEVRQVCDCTITPQTSSLVNQVQQNLQNIRDISDLMERAIRRRELAVEPWNMYLRYEPVVIILRDLSRDDSALRAFRERRNADLLQYGQLVTNHYMRLNDGIFIQHVYAAEDDYRYLQSQMEQYSHEEHELDHLRSTICDQVQSQTDWHAFRDENSSLLQNLRDIAVNKFDIIRTYFPSIDPFLKASWSFPDQSGLNDDSASSILEYFCSRDEYYIDIFTQRARTIKDRSDRAHLVFAEYCRTVNDCDDAYSRYCQLQEAMNASLPFSLAAGYAGESFRELLESEISVVQLLLERINSRWEFWKETSNDYSKLKKQEEDILTLIDVELRPLISQWQQDLEDTCNTDKAQKEYLERMTSLSTTATALVCKQQSILADLNLHSTKIKDILTEVTVDHVPVMAKGVEAFESWINNCELRIKQAANINKFKQQALEKDTAALLADDRQLSQLKSGAGLTTVDREVYQNDLLNVWKSDCEERKRKIIQSKDDFEILVVRGERLFPSIIRNCDQAEDRWWSFCVIAELTNVFFVGLCDQFVTLVNQCVLRQVHNKVFGQLSDNCSSIEALCQETCMTCSEIQIQKLVDEQHALKDLEENIRKSWRKFKLRYRERLNYMKLDCKYNEIIQQIRRIIEATKSQRNNCVEFTDAKMKVNEDFSTICQRLNDFERKWMTSIQQYTIRPTHPMQDFIRQSLDIPDQPILSVTLEDHENRLRPIITSVKNQTALHEQNINIILMKWNEYQTEWTTKIFGAEGLTSRARDTFTKFIADGEKSVEDNATMLDRLNKEASELLKTLSDIQRKINAFATSETPKTGGEGASAAEVPTYTNENNRESTELNPLYNEGTLACSEVKTNLANMKELDTNFRNFIEQFQSLQKRLTLQQEYAESMRRSLGDGYALLAEFEAQYEKRKEKICAVSELICPLKINLEKCSELTDKSNAASGQILTRIIILNQISCTLQCLSQIRNSIERRLNAVRWPENVQNVLLELEAADSEFQALRERRIITSLHADMQANAEANLQLYDQLLNHQHQRLNEMSSPHDIKACIDYIEKELKKHQEDEAKLIDLDIIVINHEELQLEWQKFRDENALLIHNLEEIAAHQFDAIVIHLPGVQQFRTILHRRDTSDIGEQEHGLEKHSATIDTDEYYVGVFGPQIKELFEFLERTKQTFRACSQNLAKCDDVYSNMRAIKEAVSVTVSSETFKEQTKTELNEALQFITRIDSRKKFVEELRKDYENWKKQDEEITSLLQELELLVGECKTKSQASQDICVKQQDYKPKFENLNTIIVSHWQQIRDLNIDQHVASVTAALQPVIERQYLALLKADDIEKFERWLNDCERDLDQAKKTNEMMMNNLNHDSLKTNELSIREQLADLSLTMTDGVLEPSSYLVDWVKDCQGKHTYVLQLRKTVKQLFDHGRSIFPNVKVEGSQQDGTQVKNVWSFVYNSNDITVFVEDYSKKFVQLANELQNTFSAFEQCFIKQKENCSSITSLCETLQANHARLKSLKNTAVTRVDKLQIEIEKYHNIATDQLHDKLLAMKASHEAILKYNQEINSVITDLEALTNQCNAARILGQTHEEHRKQMENLHTFMEEELSNWNRLNDKMNAILLSIQTFERIDHCEEIKKGLENFETFIKSFEKKIDDCFTENNNILIFIDLKIFTKVDQRILKLEDNLELTLVNVEDSLETRLTKWNTSYDAMKVQISEIEKNLAPVRSRGEALLNTYKQQNPSFQNSSQSALLNTRFEKIVNQIKFDLDKLSGREPPNCEHMKSLLRKISKTSMEIKSLDTEKEKTKLKDWESKLQKCRCETLKKYQEMADDMRQRETASTENQRSCSQEAINRIMTAGDNYNVMFALLKEIWTVSDLKKSFHKLSKLVHPDKCALPEATKAFQLLNNAYDKALMTSDGEHLIT